VSNLPAAKPNKLDLPVAPRQREILEAFGTEGLLEMISNGHSHAGIAKSLGVDRGTLTNYLLQSADRELYALAYQRSAEALTDKAEAKIEALDYETVTAAQVALAKLQADFLMRKAGQRNAKYREKAPVDDAAAPAAAAPPQFVLVVHGTTSVEGRQVTTYENDSPPA
jgi:HPt (histidine-containing phosphotransfer) domain-containing protein